MVGCALVCFPCVPILWPSMGLRQDRPRLPSRPGPFETQQPPSLILFQNRRPRHHLNAGGGGGRAGRGVEREGHSEASALALDIALPSPASCPRRGPRGAEEEAEGAAVGRGISCRFVLHDALLASPGRTEGGSEGGRKEESSVPYIRGVRSSARRLVLTRPQAFYSWFVRCPVRWGGGGHSEWRNTFSFGGGARRWFAFVSGVRYCCVMYDMLLLACGRLLWRLLVAFCSLYV